MDFKKLTLGDIATVRPFMLENPDRLCDVTVGGTFMWRDYFKTEYTVACGSLIFRIMHINGKPAFSLPLGGDFDGALSMLYDFSRSCSSELYFATVSAADLAALKNKFPDIQAVPERNWYDYLYLAEDFASFSGRRFSGQRNHMNHFKRAYPDFSFSLFTPQDAPEVREFLCEHARVSQKDSPIAIAEQEAVLEVMDNFELYGMSAGVLRANNKIIGFTAGERTGDTVYVHIEKANTDFQGAYQVLSNEYAKLCVNQGAVYINREDDSGDEGLRTSKLSYHPVELLEKYTVKIN
ncbi:MAG: DUF2156 domain-containing protein [Clostridiales bacterium]|nr:DUF2156 domain-containing protein [Clostridiales bacterium]